MCKATNEELNYYRSSPILHSLKIYISIFKLNQNLIRILNPLILVHALYPLML